MSETNIARLPRHVAIIMDGNGRWAKAHKLAVAQGHRQGTEALRAIIRESSDIGIEALTIYAFSTENWRRSRAEVSALMSLLLEYFTSEIDELDEKNVCIRILGDKDGLPAPQRDALIAAAQHRHQLRRAGGNRARGADAGSKGRLRRNHARGYRRKRLCHSAVHP